MGRHSTAPWSVRIALYSDLHLEMLPSGWEPPALDVDVVMLAGDISSHTQGIEWAAQTFRATSPKATVLYVAGNHEYYGAEFYGVGSEMREIAAQFGVTLLENDKIEIQGVRFLGTTLWSDFKLYGSDEWTARSLHVARDSLSDYTMIRKPGGLMEPQDAVALHEKAAAWLADELAKPFEGKTVVVTHFAPHRRCVAAKYDGDLLTPYFTVDMSPLMRRHKIDLWAFGHTHYNIDFVGDNGCRIVSNQRGYPSDLRFPDSSFRPDLVIEL